MNLRERVITALRLGQPDRVPHIESRVDVPIQRALMGRDDFLPEELADVIGLHNLQLRQFLPPIFAEYNESGGSDYPAKPLIQTRSDLDKMRFPDPESPALYADAEALVKRNVGKYAIGASLRTGISAAHMSMGLEGFSYALADDPGFVDTVIGRYADWAIAVMGHLRDIGVDYIWTFDDIAYKSGPMLSPRVFRKVLMPHMQRVGDAIKSAGLLWILHSDGDLTALMQDLLKLGINGLHPIEPGAMDIVQVKEQFGARVCLIGNIDLHYTLTQGTVEEVEAEVKERIEAIGKGGGYIISSANSITHYCRIENVRAMIAAIRQYGLYPEHSR